MERSIETLFQDNLLKHQKELSGIINKNCMIGGFLGVGFYAGMKLLGIMSEFKWINLLYFCIPMLFNTSLLGISNWYLKRKEDKVYVNVFKYFIILSACINYLALAYFVPYRDAWGIFVLIFFIGAYYLDFKLVTFCVILTSAISFTTFFFNTSVEVLAHDLPNFLIRVQTVSFGGVAAYVSTLLGRKMLLNSCKNEFNLGTILENIQAVNTQVEKTVSKLSFTSEHLSEVSKIQYTGTKMTATSIAAIQEETIRTSESVQECVDLINNLTSNTMTMQDQTKDAINNSEQLKQTAVLGTNSIETAIGSLVSIKDSAIKTYDSAKEMDERTKKIQAIVGDIQNIVEETSLLSLNASIEAARAGEYGKGFSVVADSIRRLSEQSKKSLENIDVVISYMGRHEGTVNVLVDRVDEGVGVIHKFSQYYNEIINNIESTMASLNTINSLVEKQEENAISVTDFILKVKQMSDVVNQNIQETSAATEQGFASCEQLLEAAKQLEVMSKELSALVNEK